MTFATLDYQDIRSAVLQLPQQQRLQLIKDAIDEQPTVSVFDFAQTLADLQTAFTQLHPFTEQAIDDARLAHLLEKHGA